MKDTIPEHTFEACTNCHWPLEKDFFQYQYEPDGSVVCQHCGEVHQTYLRIINIDEVKNWGNIFA